jgi:hypothetical protein
MDHRSVVGDPDRDPQQTPSRAGAPGGPRVVVAHVPESEQVHQVRPARRHSGAGGHGPSDPHRERCQAAREGLGRSPVALVGRPAERVPAHCHRGDRRPDRAVRALVHNQAQPTVVLRLPPPSRQVQPGEATAAARGGEELTWELTWGQDPAVHHQQHVGTGRTLVDTGWLVEVARQQRGEIGNVGGDHPPWTGRVGLLHRQRVGQPLHPVPLGEGLLRGQDRDQQVLRRVEHRRPADHRPGERPCLFCGTADLDPVVAP